MNIQEAFPHIPFLQNEPMSRHTTFRIGGPAQWFVQPQLSELQPLLSYCKEEQIPVTVIGNGSNLLVGDKGIRGLVLDLVEPSCIVQGKLCIKGKAHPFGVQPVESGIADKNLCRILQAGCAAFGTVLLKHLVNAF